AEIIKREPKLDILVNNAGAAWGADFDEFPESGWDKVMDLNVKSLFFLTKPIKDSIVVTAIAPGAFSSDMNKAARDHGDEVAKRIPAQRIGTDEDMAG